MNLLPSRNALGAIGLVARRELRERGLSRSYLISWVVLVLLVGAVFVVRVFFDDRGETPTYQVGSVGAASEPVIDTASRMASASDPPFNIVHQRLAARIDARRAVAEGNLDIALVDGAELIVEEAGGSRLVSVLQQSALSHRIEELVSSGEASEQVIALLSGRILDVTPTAPSAGEETDNLRFLIGQAALVLLFMAIVMTGSWVLLGVTEEKTSRVVEVLLATIQPRQLLVGKIAGVGLLGLLQFSVLVTGIVVGIRFTLGPGFLPELDTGLMVTLIVWFLLGYTLYAIGYAAVGAITSRPEDAQNAAFPMTLVSLVGYFTGMFYVGQNPDSTLSFVLSLVPVTAPFVVPVRTVADAVSVWEQLLAIVLVLGFAALLIRVAGRVYAGGVFKYQSRIKLREAFRSAEF